MKWIIHPIKSFIMWFTTKKFVKLLEEGTMDVFLEVLLSLMDLYFALDRKFRKNIKDFNASYVFKSRDGVIAASAIFNDSEMKVSSEAIVNPTVSVEFKDGIALKNFLFSESPDIISAILDCEIRYTGNLNYISKFAYMSKRLKTQLLGN